MRQSVMFAATIVGTADLSASPISVKRSMAQGVSINPARGIHIGIGHHPVEHHHPTIITADPITADPITAAADGTTAADRAGPSRAVSVSRIVVTRR